MRQVYTILDKIKTILRFNFNLDKSLQNFFQGISNRVLNIKKFYIFYLIYTLMSLSVILIWTILPVITLIVFLAVASFHFGKEDTQFLITNNSNLISILYFFRGLLVIVIPLYFNFDETVTIFKMLLIDNEQFYSGLSFIEKYKIIEIAISLSALSSIILFLSEFNIKKFAIFLILTV